MLYSRSTKWNIFYYWCVCVDYRNPSQVHGRDRPYVMYQVFRWCNCWKGVHREQVLTWLCNILHGIDAGQFQHLLCYVIEEVLLGGGRGFTVGEEGLGGLGSLLWVDSVSKFIYIFSQSLGEGSGRAGERAIYFVLDASISRNISGSSSFDILMFFFEVDPFDVKIPPVPFEGAGGHKSLLHFAQSGGGCLSGWHVFILILFL